MYSKKVFTLNLSRISCISSSKVLFSKKRSQSNGLMFFKNFRCTLGNLYGTQVEKYCFNMSKICKSWNPWFIVIQSYKAYCFHSTVCLLFAKLTFENYKLLTQYFQKSKLLHKEYTGFFGFRKIST